MNCKYTTALFCLLFCGFSKAQTPSSTNVTPPANCSINGALYPSSTCNIYYRCEQFLWIFNVVEQTCPTGQAFNPTSQVCEASSTCGIATTTPLTTTQTTTVVAGGTTPQGVTPPANCSINGTFYPSATCNIYYRCVQALWNYYVVEQTCPVGQAFNPTSQICEASSTCVGTTTAPVTRPASCSTNGALYPSSTCNIYYRCEQFLWIFNVVEQTCPTGQAFNPTSQVCEASSTCGIATTTPLTTTQTTTVVAGGTTPQGVTPPANCSTNGAFYPSATCNIYYRCVQALWNFYVVEQTCPTGEAFNPTSQLCEASSTCVGTITTTTPTIRT